jgi:hypothetical protein
LAAKGPLAAARGSWPTRISRVPPFFFTRVYSPIDSSMGGPSSMRHKRF